jgi:hypothetical protein
MEITVCIYPQVVVQLRVLSFAMIMIVVRLVIHATHNSTHAVPPEIPVSFSKSQSSQALRVRSANSASQRLHLKLCDVYAAPAMAQNLLLHWH